jgi:hypothetical protein
MKDPNKRYQILKKEINEDTKGWKDIPCSWIDRISIMKMLYTKSNVYVQRNPCQNPNDILHRKINHKIHMKAQKTLNS